MKFLLIFIITLFFTSCLNVDCKKSTEAQRHTECYIIAEKIPNPKSKHRFKIIGFNPKTKKEITYVEENRWFCEFYPYIQEGDTISKKKNELIFTIHKKDTVLQFSYQCNGKSYE